MCATSRYLSWRWHHPRISTGNGFGSRVDLGIQNTGGSLSRGGICWPKSSVSVRALVWKAGGQINDRVRNTLASESRADAALLGSQLT